MEPATTPNYPTPGSPAGYPAPGYPGAVVYDSRPHSPTVTIGDWILTYIILLIPFANFIMLFVWAFSSSTPPSKANWAKAGLLFYAILIGLGVLFWGTIAALIGLGSHGSHY